jgi:hypothetical protein
MRFKQKIKNREGFILFDGIYKNKGCLNKYYSFFMT